MSDIYRPIADPPYRGVGALLDEHRRRWPGKIALIDVERNLAISFGELAPLVDSVAKQLQHQGASKGSRVVLAGSEGVEKLLLWFGIWRLGAIVCPLDISFIGSAAAPPTMGIVDASLIVIAEHADADVIPPTAAKLLRYSSWPDSGEPARIDTLRFIANGADCSIALPAASTAHELASMCCTSGTTGVPKVVVYDHACYWLNGLDSIDLLNLTSDDRTLEYRSFDWYSAQILSLMPFLQLGSTLCVARRFSRSQFVGWIKRHRVTVSAGIPAVLNLLLEAPIDVRDDSLASLRVMTSSTAPLSPVQWMRFEETYGIRIVNLYGSSEAGWMCGNRPSHRRIGTVGYPAPRISFEIVDANGMACAPEQEGQVVVGGQKLALGMRLADGSQSAIRGTTLYTRDVATRDHDGFVRVSGRTDDLIIRGGVKIVPQEIEDVVLTYPCVNDAAALGVPDPIYGQEPVCFVVARPGVELDADQMLTHCRARLPHEKVPKQIYIVDTLPKNARGKIVRDKLRREWWTSTHRPK